MLNFTMHIDDSGDRLCKTSGNLWVGKIGTLFNQRLDGNQLDTGNNWTTFNTSD